MLRLRSQVGAVNVVVITSQMWVLAEDFYEKLRITVRLWNIPSEHHYEVILMRATCGSLNAAVEVFLSFFETNFALFLFVLSLPGLY